MEIRSVLPKDAIPSIDDPQFGPSYFGEDDDRVLIATEFTPRAYAFRILDFHEIVNDEIDQHPIAVTWCPLCASAIVFDRRVDGQTLTFGVSGKLADDDLVMYDRETGSEWKQSLGRCIAGSLEGEELSIRPSTVMTAADAREAYPSLEFLQPTDTRSEAASENDEPAEIDYTRRPYEAYFNSTGFGLDAHRGNDAGRRWMLEDIDPKTMVLGLEIDGAVRGYPYPVVQNAGGYITDALGGQSVLVVATSAGMDAFVQPTGAVRYEDGQLNIGGATVDPHTGTSTDGPALERLPSRRLFAFTWVDDYGADALYRPDESR